MKITKRYLLKFINSDKVNKELMKLRSDLKERQFKNRISEIKKYKRFERIAATTMYLLPVAAFAPSFLKSYRDWAFGQVDWMHSITGIIILSGIVGTSALSSRYDTKLKDTVSGLNNIIRQEGKEVEVKNNGWHELDIALYSVIGKIKVVMRHNGVEETIA